jgi:hypothetical protein
MQILIAFARQVISEFKSKRNRQMLSILVLDPSLEYASIKAI